MNGFRAKYEAAVERNHSLLCVGLDPDAGQMPPGADVVDYRRTGRVAGERVQRGVRCRQEGRGQAPAAVGLFAGRAVRPYPVRRLLAQPFDRVDGLGTAGAAGQEGRGERPRDQRPRSHR